MERGERSVEEELLQNNKEDELPPKNKEEQTPEIVNPFKEVAGELEEKDFHRTLYRESNTGDIYLLWRDKTLPLKHFGGSIDSGLAEGTLSTFWFDKPMVFDRGNFRFLLKTDLKQWPNRPQYYGKGYMHFKSQGHSFQDSRYGGWSTPKSILDEYYLGDVIPSNQLEVFSEESDPEIVKAISSGLEKILKLFKSGKRLQISQGDFGALQTEDEDIQEAYDLIYNIFDEALIDERHRNIGDQKLRQKEEKQRFKEYERQLIEFLNNPSQIEKIIEFYKWARALPKVKEQQIGDLDTPAKGDIVISSKTRRVIIERRKKA